VFVFDDLKVIDAKLVAISDELDRLECAVANVDTPCETGAGHDVSLRDRQEILPAKGVGGGASEDLLTGLDRQVFHRMTASRVLDH
jgi:hypothetical protein